MNDLFYEPPDPLELAPAPEDARSPERLVEALRYACGLLHTEHELRVDVSGDSDDDCMWETVCLCPPGCGEDSPGFIVNFCLSPHNRVSVIMMNDREQTEMAVDIDPDEPDALLKAMACLFIMASSCIKE